MDKVAVVIPNYNGYRYLETCFAALAKQTVTEFTTYFVDRTAEAIVIIELDDFRLRVVFPQKRTALIL